MGAPTIIPPGVMSAFTALPTCRSEEAAVTPDQCSFPASTDRSY